MPNLREILVIRSPNNFWARPTLREQYPYTTIPTVAQIVKYSSACHLVSATPINNNNLWTMITVAAIMAVKRVIKIDRLITTNDL